MSLVFVEVSTHSRCRIPVKVETSDQGSTWQTLHVPTISVAVATSKEAPSTMFVGQTIRLRARFIRREASSEDGPGFSETYFNPDGLSVFINGPGGTSDITAAAESSSTGHFYVDIEPPEPGDYKIRWKGTDGSGGPVGVGFDKFTVDDDDI